ncbi:hypothetical protein AUO94_07185 [Planococcus kocurii]|uniref:DUF2599 domain-containing protein n=1 Tax=Planococcus kocurii TaxID=1374 RepID=A0ABM5WVT6_9BACL|nr:MULTISPECIES: DUF2599 domain-containing protein [Planococcus]ALS78459.1 hypothetical protein AUO94_07185 [Planococcus kocurii]MCH4826917.1 DUF2599 domain-containing protein [Planococcus halocryophilus]
MKNKMKMVFITLTILMVFGNLAPASAATETNEFEYLRDAIATIDAVPFEEVNQYVEDNGEWIDEIGVRLETYIETFPEEQQNDEVKRLLSDDFMVQDANKGANSIQMASLSGNLDEYFTDVWFHLRSGYHTYSMEPKWSVRLWKITMEAAWDELGDNYIGIQYDNGSLWNQYKCHFDYDVFGALAGSWDLEVGRPIVSGVVMVRELCNPE